MGHRVVVCQRLPLLYGLPRLTRIGEGADDLPRPTR
jgi:hypothetical protein